MINGESVNWFSIFILFDMLNRITSDERIATQQNLNRVTAAGIKIFYLSALLQMAKCLLFPASMVFDTSQSLNLLHF
jgi:hypothetical protein